MQSATAATATAVDLSGDGGVTREIVQEGKGKGLATGDIAMVRFSGTVAETGQVRARLVFNDNKSGGFVTKLRAIR